MVLNPKEKNIMICYCGKKMMQTRPQKFTCTQCNVTLTTAPLQRVIAI